MWIYFSCESVLGYFVDIRIVFMFKSEAMFGYPSFHFLPARLPPVFFFFLDFASPDAKHFTVSKMSSFRNVLRRISETRTSSVSVWVTPRRESVYLGRLRRQILTKRRNKNISGLLSVSSSEAFLGVRQTSMQQMCLLIKGNEFTFHWNYADCDFNLNRLQSKEFSFSGNLTQWEGSEPRYNTLVHKFHL